MAEIFVNTLGEDLKTEYSRANGKGYNKVKSLGVSDLLNGVTQNVVIEPPETTIEIKTSEDKAVAGSDAYVMLCKEFGVVNSTVNSAKISVVFLDNGYMLVKQLSGNLLVNVPMADKKVNIMCLTNGEGNDIQDISYTEHNVEWISEDKLLNCVRQYGKVNNDSSKGKFPYEFEHVFSINSKKLNSDCLRIRMLID